MNRFILNVALNGKHYCKVELPEDREVEAVAKAKTIAATFGDRFEYSLTCWNDIGTIVSMR